MRKLLIGLGVLLLLGLAFSLIGKFYLNKHIAAFIEEANLGKDSLSIADYQLSLRPFAAGITAYDLYLDQEVNGHQLQGHIESLELGGFSLWALAGRRRYVVNKLELISPQLTCRSLPDSLATNSSSFARGAIVKKVNIEGGAINYQNDSGADRLRCTGIKIGQQDFVLPMTAASMGLLKLEWDSLVIPGSRADLEILRAELDTEEETLDVERFQLSPRQTAAAVTLGPQSDDWIAVRADSLHFRSFQAQQLLDTNWLSIENCQINTLNIIVAAAAKPRAAKDFQLSMPVEHIRKIGIPFELAQLENKHFNIEYQVFNTSDSMATVAFRNGHLSMEKITNQVLNDSMRAKVECSFDGQSRLNSNFAFNLGGAGRDWSIRGRVGGYDMTQINPFLILAANAEIKAGQLQYLNYEQHFSEEQVRGRLLMPYDNLRVKIVGPSAWYANLFKGLVFKNHNSGDNIRMGTIYHEHEPGRSFFNAYWKGILSGMRSSTLGDIVLPKELE